MYYGGDNEYFDYDKVVIATHADEALSLIEKVKALLLAGLLFEISLGSLA